MTEKPQHPLILKRDEVVQNDAERLKRLAEIAAGHSKGLDKVIAEMTALAKRLSEREAA